MGSDEPSDGLPCDRADRGATPRSPAHRSHTGRLALWPIPHQHISQRGAVRIPAVGTLGAVPRSLTLSVVDRSGSDLAAGRVAIVSGD